MDLSDTLVTTRKITATLSPDEIRTAAIGAVRLKAGVAPDAEVLQAATLNADGSVSVNLSVVVPAQPEAVAPEAPVADAAPAAPPISDALNLTV